MADPILYGPAYSTYARSARLALEEKGVAYTLEEIDFIQGGMPPEQAARHPFAKVPALDHDGFLLYETCAIERYVDETFEGPSLQPGDARGRARMSQIISLVDSYMYGPTISQLVVQRLITPMMGGTPDEAAIEAALPEVRTCVGSIEALVGDQAFLAGEALSLADLHLIPVFAYLKMTPESALLVDDSPFFVPWWDSVSTRESVTKTQPQLG